MWSKVGHTDKAQQVLSSELLRALDSPLATHLNDNGDNDDNDGKTQSAQALKERHSLQADLTGRQIESCPTGISRSMKVQGAYSMDL